MAAGAEGSGAGGSAGGGAGADFEGIENLIGGLATDQIVGLTTVGVVTGTTVWLSSSPLPFPIVVTGFIVLSTASGSNQGFKLAITPNDAVDDSTMRTGVLIGAPESLHKPMALGGYLPLLGGNLTVTGIYIPVPIQRPRVSLEVRNVTGGTVNYGVVVFVKPAYG